MSAAIVVRGPERVSGTLPRPEAVITRLNDYEIKLVRIKGEFVWHTHEDTDELFLVIDGTLTIQLRDGDVTVCPGQLFVVPRGVQHCPIADGEVQAMLIEPAGVTNLGDAGGPLRRRMTTRCARRLLNNAKSALRAGL